MVSSEEKNALLLAAILSSGSRMGALFDAHRAGSATASACQREWLRFLLLTGLADQAGLEWRTGSEGSGLDARLVAIAEGGSTVFAAMHGETHRS